MKIVFVVLLMVSISLPIKRIFSQTLSFKGYYVEVIIKTNMGNIKHGSFMIENSALSYFFDHFGYSDLLYKYPRLFDYSGETFRYFELTIPDSFKNYYQIDWNSSKVLSYIEDGYAHTRSFQIVGNPNYMFYIKTVDILYEKINNITPNWSSQDQLDHSDSNNYILTKIIDQVSVSDKHFSENNSSLVELDIESFEKFFKK